jgi:UDP-N-acetylglucosamine--N-acetylmuramyl-(pentapeptide) pyrophosphoryl-undecaprenol N-acetylglucosamine transferase
LDIGKVPKDEALKRFGFQREKFTLLIFGGSLGSSKINQVAFDALERLLAEGVQILFIVGRNYSFKLDLKIDESVVKVFDYLDDMSFAYGACDLVLCRAGAVTLAEISICGLPSIVVPYPYATDDHQLKNANYFIQRGASILIEDKELVPDRLVKVISELLKDHKKIRSMADNARKIGEIIAKQQMADFIADMI